jgi:hypothetical protein
MANTKKGSWKKERASVNSKSNKYRPMPADKSKRPASGSSSRYWRAGYTRKDGTEVKGHYVQKSR